MGRGEFLPNSAPQFMAGAIVTPIIKKKFGVF